MGRHVERLEFLDVMLGDRPALTPSESFYQRLLAGDPDEAQDHAAALLKECSLSSYYDGAVIEALRFASDDLARGALSAARFERVKGAIEGIVAELERYEDRGPAAAGSLAPSSAGQGGPKAQTKEMPVESAPPPGWRGKTAVLCVAGRGPLDTVRLEEAVGGLPLAFLLAQVPDGADAQFPAFEGEAL